MSAEMIGVVMTASGGLLSIGMMWGRNQTLREDMDKKIDGHIADAAKIEYSIKSQVSKMWEWKDAHEKEVANTRLEVQKQFGKMEASLQVHDSQYSEIVRLIANMNEAISKKIDQLENSLRESRK